MHTLTLSLIQSKLYWENKAANLAMFEEKIASLPAHAEVVILPEMFSTGFTMNATEFAEEMDAETVNWMQRMAKKYNVVLTGSLIIKEASHFYNRLIWMLPNAEYGYYDKRHLFAYANEHEHFTPGNKRLIASVKGWKINLLVCYDLRFPVWSMQQLTRQASIKEPAPEFDLMIYVANWPERRSHAWKTLLCARAIENQAFVAGVNRVGKDGNDNLYSGNSMLVDPLGEVLYHNDNDEDIFTITIEKEQLNDVRTKFPFWRDGDGFRIDG